MGLGATCKHITKTRLFKYTENPPPKYWQFSDKKNSDIFHISAQNIDCGYSLDPPRRGGSNEYSQSMFLSRNKKNNLYPCKLQFYCIKAGFKRSDQIASTCIWSDQIAYTCTWSAYTCTYSYQMYMIRSGLPILVYDQIRVHIGETTYICTFWHVRHRTVWSVFFVCMKKLCILGHKHVPSEDSDQTARVLRLIWIFAVRKCQNVRFLTFRVIRHKSSS